MMLILSLYAVGGLLTLADILCEYLDATPAERREFMPDVHDAPAIAAIVLMWMALIWPWVIWDVYFAKDSDD